MRWIRVDVDSPEHRKVSRLAEILEINPVSAFGLYIRFLTWCGRFCELGDVSKHTPYEIGRGAGALEAGLNPTQVYATFIDTGIITNTEVAGWGDRQSSAYWNQTTKTKRGRWREAHPLPQDNPRVTLRQPQDYLGHKQTNNTNNTNKQTNTHIPKSNSKRASKKSQLPERTKANLKRWRDTFNVPKRRNTQLRVRKMQALEKAYTDPDIETIFDNLKQSKFHFEGGFFDFDGKPLCNPDLCEKFLYLAPKNTKEEGRWRPIQF